MASLPPAPPPPEEEEDEGRVDERVAGEEESSEEESSEEESSEEEGEDGDGGVESTEEDEEESARSGGSAGASTSGGGRLADDRKSALEGKLDRQMSVFATRGKVKEAQHTVSYKDSSSQIHYYSSTGQADIVEQILKDDGAKDSSIVNSLSNDQRTPLHIAAALGHINVMEVLVEHGANIEARMNDGMSSLVLTALKDMPEAMRFLLKRGALTTVQTIKDGYGAMHLAAMYCNLRAARVLLQHVENEAKTSSNPQHIRDFVDMQTHKGYTALHFAVVEDCLPFVRMLVDDFGAQVNIMTEKGYCALHFAAHVGSFEICEYLIKSAGANPVLRTGSRLAAIDIAKERGHEVLYDLLDLDRYQHLEKERKRIEKEQRKALKKQRKKKGGKKKKRKGADDSDVVIIEDDGPPRIIFDRGDRPPTNNELLKDLSGADPLLARIRAHPELVAALQENPLELFDQLSEEHQTMIIEEFHAHPNLMEDVIKTGEKLIADAISENPDILFDSVQNPFTIARKNKNPYKLVRKLQKNPNMVLEKEWQEHPELIFIGVLQTNEKIRERAKEKMEELNPRLATLLPLFLGDEALPTDKNKGVSGKMMRSRPSRALTKRLVKGAIKKSVVTGDLGANPTDVVLDEMMSATSGGDDDVPAPEPFPEPVVGDVDGIKPPELD